MLYDDVYIKPSKFLQIRFLSHNVKATINRELSPSKKQASCFLMGDNSNSISAQISKNRKSMRHSVYLHQTIINFSYCDGVLKL